MLRCEEGLKVQESISSAREHTSTIISFIRNYKQLADARATIMQHAISYGQSQRLQKPESATSW